MDSRFLSEAEQYAPYFFACRLPGDTDVRYGVSDTVTEKGSGFVVTPFDPSGSLLVIPFGEHRILSRQKVRRNFFPDVSTSKAHYSAYLSEAINALRSNAGLNKVVISRVESHPRDFSLDDIFRRLCHEYPESFIFCFGTPDHGVWTGASPELLLSRLGKELSAMSLAGTRPAGSSLPWDEKNIREQAIVTDYIRATFTASGLTPVVEKPGVKQAGPVEHLCTGISAVIPEGISPETIASLPYRLSPTPALCGDPKDAAFRLISSLEPHDRHLYGGFCGLRESDSRYQYFVTLRCMAVGPRDFLLYMGGGITSESEIDKEWKETEQKALTLLRVVQK